MRLLGVMLLFGMLSGCGANHGLDVTINITTESVVMTEVLVERSGTERSATEQDISSELKIPFL